MTKIENEKIDRLENHFKVYKKDMVDVVSSVNNIENALIGSVLNGNKGMVHLLDDIKNRVKELEEKQILTDEFSKNLKWFHRGLLGILFAYITYLIKK
jgi:O-phosphoseryl-tRNA(Cys) synthetase